MIKMAESTQIDFTNIIKGMEIAAETIKAASISMEELGKSLSAHAPIAYDQLRNDLDI